MPEVRQMQISNYHAAVDGRPLGLGGAILEGDKLRYVYNDELDRVVDLNPRAETRDTTIRNTLWDRLNPLRNFERYIVWSMKRALKKRKCNFAYIQAGAFYIITDFFKIEQIPAPADTQFH